MARILPLASVLALLLVQGCAMTAGEREYPRGWKPPVPMSEGKCPDIAGTYENTGYTGPLNALVKQNDGPFLAGLLMGAKAGGAREGKIVITKSGEGELEISYLPGNREPATEGLLSLKKGDYTCGGGFMTIKKSRQVSEEITGIEMSTYRIARTYDGALVVDDHETGLGLAMCLFPVGSAENTWYRYETEKQGSGR